MATIIRYVNTASTPGGDGTTNATAGANRAYASLSAAEAALRQNLTGVTCDIADPDGNNTIALDIRCTGTAADTTRVEFSNASWVTDASHRIMVRLNPSDTPGGAKWTTSIYRLAVSASYGAGALAVGRALHLVFWNLQVDSTNTLDNAPRALVLGDFTWSVDIVGGFFRVSSTSGTPDGPDAIVTTAVGAFSLRMRNVTVAGPRKALGAFEYNPAAYTLILYNCTLINRGANEQVVDIDDLDTGGACRLKNVLIQGATGAAANIVATTPDEAVDILTQDASGTSGNQNQTVTFVDAANWDYHLGGADTNAKDQGTSLAADGAWPFTTDGDGATRSGSWDIGADEITAGGGSAVPKKMQILMAA